MGGNIPPEVFQEYMERQRLAEARERRITARTILAEMVRQEIADRSLSWRRRRALVRFAGKFGIDEYEAGLLIRAAEFSFASPEERTHADEARQYLASLEEPAMNSRIWVIATALLVNTLGLIWFLKR
ncbi:MAG TPA: hypothetical protein VMV81_11170 [Phycisphaerae bacterium]|nr:hypothetical protein [Phycisphaerae bacterium]